MAPIAHRFPFVFFTGLAALALGACSSSPASSILTETDAGHTPPLFCPPGLQVACACPDGSGGAKVCDASGQAYGVCLGCTSIGPDDAGKPSNPDASGADTGTDAMTRDGGGRDGGPREAGTDSAAPVCNDGATRCDGTQPQVCIGGAWTSSGDDCSIIALLCLDGVCAECSPGATQCDAQEPQTCSATGSWTNGTPCVNQACQGGACVGLCAPGAVACDPDGVPETCDATGEWHLESACGMSQTCIDGACAGICGPGETQCDDASNGVDSCTSDGEWSAPMPCTGQTCIDGACSGVCAPGDLGCSGLQPQTCDATGNWQNSGAACVSPDTCILGVCGTSAIPTTCTQADGEIGCCGPDGQNYYCGDGVTVTPVMCAAGTVCGWSATEGYYDCVPPPSTSDPSDTYAIACQ